MTDEEILKDREEKYGSPDLFFSTYGSMCRLLDCYAEESYNSTINVGHISAMKMVLLKVLRSVWNPELEDNYCDARNYISIAEKCVNEKNK